MNHFCCPCSDGLLGKNVGPASRNKIKLKHHPLRRCRTTMRATHLTSRLKSVQVAANGHLTDTVFGCKGWDGDRIPALQNVTYSRLPLSFTKS